jgi:atypical dual specificity phosphatase
VGARTSRREPPGPERYWVVPDRLMGGEWPGAHLDWLHAAGVSVLVNLTESTYRDDRFRIHRIPLPDGRAPGEAAIARFCGLVGRELLAGSRIYAHCVAGCGRTGTMMACYLVYRERCDGPEAVARVRALRPCSVENDAQADAVRGWALLMRATGYELPA